MLTPLIASVALMYAILIGVNLPAPLLGLEFESTRREARLWFEPPGFVIPIAWFVLFAFLGAARYVLAGASGPHLQWLVVAFAVLCASYAYYTLGLAKLTGISALWFGLWGNLAVIAGAVYVAYRVAGVSTVASLLVAPVALWTGFATAIVLGQMRAQKLLP